jgi:hypothetical protein
MPPKTPKQLREQIEAQQDKPAEEGYEWSAEGLKVRTPDEGELFGNLEKVARPPKKP